MTNKIISNNLLLQYYSITYSIHLLYNYIIEKYVINLYIILIYYQSFIVSL